jgi:hypothetical protein
MADSSDQQAKSGENEPQAWHDKGDLSAEEADKLSEHFTPMWEQEEASTESSTMRGLAPPSSAEAPVAEAPKPAAEPAGEKVVRKQTMLGLAPPASEAAAPAKPAEPGAAAKLPEEPGEAAKPAAPAPALSPNRTMVGLAPPSQAEPPKPAPAAEPALAPKPAPSTKQAEPPASSTAPAVAPLAASSPASDLDVGYAPPKKNQKVVFGVLASAVVFLLIVGIKAVAGHSSKTNTPPPRTDSVAPTTQAAQPADTAQATTATATGTATATETAAATAPPTDEASSETAGATPAPTDTAESTEAKTSKHEASHAAKAKAAHHHAARAPVAAFPENPTPPQHKHATRPKAGSGSIVRETPF